MPPETPAVKKKGGRGKWVLAVLGGLLLIGLLANLGGNGQTTTTSAAGSATSEAPARETDSSDAPASEVPEAESRASEAASPEAPASDMAEPPAVDASAAEVPSSEPAAAQVPADEATVGEELPNAPVVGPPGFGDGTYTIGEDVEPGTYRSEGAPLCYWARLAGFSGELDDIIANGNASTIVTITSEDIGFEAQNCGEWVAVAEGAPAEPAASFGDGTYQVGEDILPGVYQADGGSDLCYWARLADFSHELDGIIANGNNSATVEIAGGDAGFEANGCGELTLQ